MDEWSKLLVCNEEVMTKSSVYICQRHATKVYKGLSMNVFLQTEDLKETDSVQF